HPDDRTGHYAWQWVWKPMAVSFTGIVRERKVRFMFHAVLAAAQVYRLTGDARYAELAGRILQCLARRFPNWLYHDMYGAFADCDPLYAAAHDTALKLDFKRHPCEMAYGGATYETGPVADTPDKARMLATFFGASRAGFPGTHGMAQFLGNVCRASDRVYDAKGTNGQPLWSDEARRDVERNLILEYALETEPWLGGPGQAQNVCNKAPEIYHGLAAVGVCLGLPEYAHVALMGFENIRDQRFLYDGISMESALYMDAFLSDMIEVTELLQGFRWPERFKERAGVVDVYGSDPKFRRMMRAVVEELRSDGTWLPLSDTMPGYSNRKHVFEIGARRYPDFPAGLLPLVYENGADWYSGFSYKGWLLAQSENSRTRGGPPTPYALFNLEAGQLESGPEEQGDFYCSRRTKADAPENAPLRGAATISKFLCIESNRSAASAEPPGLPEIYFPAWMTAILRHGQGPEATDLALAFNAVGGHRHNDNLSLFYSTRGRAALGDLGYMADTPFLLWYISSFSHNL
ncbi:MAG: hypothetical protein Q8O57_11350, partial [Kiritimatiellota bacterium]|nr:hypothetical protein [Kiritimatiellota bacterium]